MTSSEGLDQHDAPTRAVTLEIRDEIAIIRLDQPGKPVNVLSEGVIGELTAIIERLERRETSARGVVILSGKPGVWIAGADVEQLGAISTAAEGEALSRRGHALLDRVASLRIPVVAAIDGVALGGGLELALACTWRLASDSPRTKVGLPEVQLGLLPGAGGSQRLPRLVGLRAALDLMLTGKQLDGRRARKIGLVDEVVPAPILEDRALAAARELAAGSLKPKSLPDRGSPQRAENLPGLRSFIFRKARQEVLEKTHGLYPAPLEILDVVSRGLGSSLEEGLAIEAAAFGRLAITPEARSLIHIFFTSTAAKNDPMLPEGTRPEDVDRIAVVGAGFMGAGIAAVTATREMRVRLKDIAPEAVARGLQTARTSIRKSSARRRMRDHEVTAILDRLDGTADYTGFRKVDLVIEAVYEDLALKHQVIREIEEATGPDAVLASNTSTIPIAGLAEASSRPERLIGLHFFSPVEKMPLVEIIRGPATTDAVTATCHAYAKRIGKTPIIVNDGPGFYVNRILGPYMTEATHLIEEGVTMEDIDDALVGWGFPVGPITLFDEVGLDVAAKSGEILEAAFPDRSQPTQVVHKLLADDRKGRKNGRGFYRFEEGRKADPDEAVYRLIGSPPAKKLSPDTIVERLVLGMVNEAVRTLEDGVLRSARDGDVGAVFGFGFPAFRGGPFWYIDTVGPARIVDRLRALESVHGRRFSPASLLVEMAQSGSRFHSKP